MKLLELFCDRCEENHATQKTNNYGYIPDEYLCDICAEYGQGYPDYDAPTIDETHAAAWQEHQELHRR